MQSTAVYSFDEFQFIIIFFWNCFLCLLRNIYLISTNEDFLPCFFQEALKFLLSHDLFMLTFVYLCMYEVMVKVHDYSSECSNICWRLSLTSLNFLCCKSIGSTVCRSILELYFFFFYIQLYIWSYINTMLPQLI